MCVSPVKHFAAHLAREVDTATVRRECRRLQACNYCLFPCWHAFVCAPCCCTCPRCTRQQHAWCCIIATVAVRAYSLLSIWWFIARPRLYLLFVAEHISIACMRVDEAMRMQI